MMTPFITIAFWLVAYFTWMWVLASVNKAFWYTAKSSILMSLTFYTLGLYGVFLLLGRQNRSAALAKWVRYLLVENEVVKKRGWNFIRKDELRQDEIFVEDDDDDDDYMNNALFFENHEYEAEDSCDMLDYVLNKSIGKGAEKIEFKCDPNSLKINYYVKNVIIDNDEIIDGQIRQKVIKVLKGRTKKIDNSDVLLWESGDVKVTYKCRSAAHPESEVIILVQK